MTLDEIDELKKSWEQEVQITHAVALSVKISLREVINPSQGKKMAASLSIHGDIDEDSNTGNRALHDLE